MHLSVVLGPRDPATLQQLADAIGEGDGRAPPLARAALHERFGPPAEAVDGLCRWLASAGADPRIDASAGARRIRAQVDVAAVERLLGVPSARALIRVRRWVGERARAVMPAAHAHAVRAIELSPSWIAARPFAIEAPSSLVVPAPRGGVTPAMLARGYQFDDAYDGAGETIAVLALGGLPRAQDLFAFWRCFGVTPPRVEVIPLTGAPAAELGDGDRAGRLETTMVVQWIGAMAPGARICVYAIDPRRCADPWSELLLAVLGDRERAPSIAVTTWTAPARQYYAVHGRELIAGLLDEAAVAGITVIAASGDVGAYDGFPRAGPERSCCDALTARATFPGCEPRVLSVGGTQVRDLGSWREQAWSAPVSDDLAAMTGLPGLAGSGGASEHVAIPDYQRRVLPGALERGAGAPPLIPSGRVQPDVALMAWGPDAPSDHGVRPSAYACVFEGAARDDAGGTSLAAPVWAALCARINQARQHGGLARLGWIQPRLYRACVARPELMRDIDEGSTDIELPVADEGGGRRWARLAGFRARPGFDAATGLGVPVADRLLAELSRSAPSPAAGAA